MNLLPSTKELRQMCWLLLGAAVAFGLCHLARQDAIPLNPAIASTMALIVCCAWITIKEIHDDINRYGLMGTMEKYRRGSFDKEEKQDG